MFWKYSIFWNNLKIEQNFNRIWKYNANKFSKIQRITLKTHFRHSPADSHNPVRRPLTWDFLRRIFLAVIVVVVQNFSSLTRRHFSSSDRFVLSLLHKVMFYVLTRAHMIVSRVDHSPLSSFHPAIVGNFVFVLFESRPLRVEFDSFGLSVICYPRWGWETNEGILEENVCVTLLKSF